MQFLKVLGQWLNRIFATSESIFLLFLFIGFLLFLLLLGKFIAPILTGFVFAYVLQGLVDLFTKWRVPHLLAVIVTMLLFVGALVTLSIVILPVAWTQLQQTVATLPQLSNTLTDVLNDLSEQHPTLIPADTAEAVMAQLTDSLRDMRTNFVSWSVRQTPNVIALLIFLVLVPISMFFFLKDRQQLGKFFEQFFPVERPILDRIAREVTPQLGSYIRGKFIEIVIVSTVTYFTFLLLGLQYAALLALLVGLSVIIPFIGAAVVTIPVIVVAFLQFGLTAEFFWVMLAYTVIQTLDGNLLVPLLFAEVVKLHPLAIITAVLIFGGLWGIWGLFFAIPIAIVIKAVMNAWPRRDEELTT
ncbi:MAG: AI-2E family transporter [Gammaproteobacteria bacterium]|nr:AI-2E family transporter [Gammaproteobacteria bacterium]MXX94746.1 AI-2E family transporter [Gammaproteobacteria bacterium]MYF52507.1 AI-2E family transporter [Gammaproteobacteria bacterium]MYK43846.1 AI-2E family transporter [Gammaproteobacteria bacterium]